MPTETHLPASVPPLRTFYVYLSSGCNLACKHCWITPTFEQSGGTGQCLDIDLYKQAIEEAIPLGLTSIKYTGGEPLLHPEFMQMAEIATHKGLRTWMETNGTLITSEMARHLKNKTSLFQVSVSVDGAVSSSHDAIRKVPGSFDAAIKGIGHLSDAGYRPQIIMSLFPENLEEIEPLIKVAVDNGCGSVKFNIIQPSGRGEQMKTREELLSIRRLLELGSFVEEELQHRYKIPLMFSWPMAFKSLKNLISRASGNCNLLHVLGILSSGHLAMCGIGIHEKDLVYGKLGIDKVSDVWKRNPALQRLRADVPDKLGGVCKVCFFRKRCLGACVALNYHNSRSLTSPYWLCDQAHKEGLFPKSRLKDGNEC